MKQRIRRTKQQMIAARVAAAGQDLAAAANLKNFGVEHKQKREYKHQGVGHNVTTIRSQTKQNIESELVGSIITLPEAFNATIEPRLIAVRDESNKILATCAKAKEQLVEGVDEKTRNLILDTIHPDGLWSIVLTVFQDDKDIMKRLLSRMYKEEFARHLNRLER